MSIPAKIKDFLDNEQVIYEKLEHEIAFTAQQIARAQHVPGREFIKSVIVAVDGQFVMCILPAVHRIDFDKLKRFLGAKEIHLADEVQVAEIFPEYEVGAEPPFGQLSGLNVYADKILEENNEIVFNAGSHTDLIRIKFKDFVRLVQPKFGSFGVHIGQQDENFREESWDEQSDDAPEA